MRAARISVAAALGLLAAAALAPSAFAHATLVRSEPAENASLSRAPREVRLVFSEPLVAEGSSARLLDVEGRPVPGARSRVEGETLVVAASGLRKGTYSVEWQVFPDDAHVRRGVLVFAVGVPIDPRAAASAGEQRELPAGQAVVRWLQLGFLTWLVGALATAVFVLPAGSARRRRVLRFAALAAGLALVAGAGLLVEQAAGLPGGLGDSVGSLLSGTRWGALWLVQEAILLVLLGLLLPLRRGIGGQALKAALPLAAALVSVQALAGHAAGLPSSSTLAVAADALHLLAASVWIGGLAALVVALWPLRQPDALERRRLLKRFGVLAAASVGVLAVTGLYSAGRHVASLDALLTTDYGLALLAKLGVALGVAGIGFATWLALRARPQAQGRVPRLLLAEAGLGSLVLLGAAVLATAVPARGPEFARAAVLPTAVTRQVDDLLVTLSVKPNRPGRNVIQVDATSTLRPEPAPIGDVLLRTGGTSGPLRETAQPGRYRLAGDLTTSGARRIDVLVRRPGLTDSLTRFDWEVAPAVMPRDVFVSNQPLGPLLAPAAAGLGAALLLLAGLAWLRRRPPAGVRMTAERLP